MSVMSTAFATSVLILFTTSYSYADVECRKVVDNSQSYLVEALNLPKRLSTNAKLQYAVLKLVCRLAPEKGVNDSTKVSAHLAISTSLPDCTESSKSLCVRQKNQAEGDAIIRSRWSNPGVRIIVQNPNFKVPQSLKNKDFNVAISTKSSEKQSVLPMGNDIRLGGGTNALKCNIYVSGASNPAAASCSGAGCIPKHTALVQNGKLVFTAAFADVPAELAIPSTPPVFIGGPDASGVWEAAPPQKDLIVRAQLTSQIGEIAECAIKFKQQGPGYIVKMKKFGDCPYYRSLRDYYYLNPKNTGAQIAGYSLEIPGFDVTYGTNGPDIPFRGVFNTALTKTGEAVVSNNTFIMPELKNREYTSAVVVGRLISPKTRDIGKPVFYGTLDINDYSLTSIEQLTKEKLSDTALVSFQVFAAHKQVGVDPDYDVRGQTGGIPMHEFTESLNGKPFDRIIPVMNESCSPVFQVRAPAREDKKLPSALQDAVSCTLSRPFNVGDIKTGRASLTVMHLTAAHSLHEFPIDLIANDEGGVASETINTTVTEKDSKTPDGGSGGDIACWIANPGNIGTADWQYGPSSSSSATETSTSTSSTSATSSSTKSVRQRLPDNECSTRLTQVTTNTTTVKTTTTTTGEPSDNSGSIGYRWSIQAINFGAGFGCAVTKDWSDEPVFAIIDPALQQQFDGPGTGYGAISCRKGTNYGTLENVSVGISALNELSPEVLARQATMYKGPGIATTDRTFVKSTAPAASTRKQKFYVRNWGYHAADLNDNAQGSFTAVMCPGSQFSHDNISLSWSPLLLDISGKGIRISRRFPRSIGFDIRGDGYKAYVDWPENPSEAAFLVVPDANNRVTSIRELFGDDTAANGFDKLKIFDSNGDNVVDAKDSKFSELRLWFDRNRNGISDDGEIESLAKNGVYAIRTQYSQPGVGGEAERKTLAGLYYNQKFGQFMSIEDHYFYEYVDSKRVKAEHRPVMNRSSRQVTSTK